MQEPQRTVIAEDVPRLKPRKKKQHALSATKKKGDFNRGKETLVQLPKTKKNISKKSPNCDASPTFQQMDASPDSATDPSISNCDYRALRHKYLLLEEENGSLVRELNEAEGEVKTLEVEKFALLDQLVVLEGLVDPSELQPQVRM